MLPKEVSFSDLSLRGWPGNEYVESVELDVIEGYCQRSLLHKTMKMLAMCLKVNVEIPASLFPIASFFQRQIRFNNDDSTVARQQFSNSEVVGSTSWVLGFNFWLFHLQF